MHQWTCSFVERKFEFFLIKFICFDEKKSLLVDACLFLLEWPLNFFQIAKNADSFRLLDLATRD